MPQSASGKKFYIGICMAGAVSAGAYTAGVMDYLLEALEEWRKRREAGEPNTPTHDVEIPVIGGASAGGMTGIITAAALNNPVPPVKPAETANAADEHPENKFYHSWVDLLGRDMFGMMLDESDMNEAQIISLLNSSFIDAVAERVVKIDTENWQPLPPYVAKNLKVFATLTNLEGFGYNISMKGTGPRPNKYYMSVHNDYACFQLTEGGATEDGWMPLDFRSGENVDVAKNAAMATGAFPIGLRSRGLKRKTTSVNKMGWMRDITDYFPLPGEDCETLNVDGGMINNEPFERVRETLNELTGEKPEGENSYNNEDSFRSTVLLIDPFPSNAPGAFKRSEKLLDVVGLTFGAMMEQMRAKPVQLANAMDEKCSGQFLIAPSRRIPKFGGGEKDVAGDGAIACGALGGFAGFLNKEFRMHDYYLGRFNCELFLRDYFTVSEEAVEKNEVFKAGYAGINKEAFRSKRKKGNHYQIIPIFSPHPADDYFPIPKFSSGKNWPVVQEKDVDAFEPAVRKRVQNLLMNAVGLKGLERFLLWVGTKVVLNKMLTRKAMATIKNSLRAQELLPREDGLREPSVKVVRKEAMATEEG